MFRVLPACTKPVDWSPWFIRGKASKILKWKSQFWGETPGKISIRVLIRITRLIDILHIPVTHIRFLLLPPRPAVVLFVWREMPIRLKWVRSTGVRRNVQFFPFYFTFFSDISILDTVFCFLFGETFEFVGFSRNWTTMTIGTTTNTTMTMQGLGFIEMMTWTTMRDDDSPKQRPTVTTTKGRDTQRTSVITTRHQIVSTFWPLIWF